MERAIVVSFNWKTQEIMFTAFEEPGAADTAVGWAHRESFLWKDFPEEEGWEHFAHWNVEAGEVRGKRKADEWIKGKDSERVPR